MKRDPLIFVLCSITWLWAALTPAAAQTRSTPAETHRIQGDKLLAGKDYPKALREYHKAYALDRSNPKSRRDAGLDLRKIGNVSLAQAHYTEAYRFYQQALVRHQRSNETGEQAKDLTNLGNASAHLKQYKAALAYYEKALPIFQRLKDRPGQVFVLSDMGAAYASLNHYSQVIAADQQAYTLSAKINNLDWQAEMLAGLVSAYLHQHLYQNASDCLEKMRRLDRLAKYRNGEARVLTTLGTIAIHQKQSAQALRDFQQALSIDQNLQNQNGQAQDLAEIGATEQSLNQYDLAITAYQQALVLFQQDGNRVGQVIALTVLGSAYDHLSQFAKAVPCYQQALPLYRALRNPKGEAITLNALGADFEYLSQYDKAIQACQAARVLFPRIKDREGEAEALMTLGNASDDLTEYAKAIGYFNAALPLFRQVKARQDEATDLNDLGNVAEELSLSRLAIQYYQQALPLYSGNTDPDGLADTLTNLAIAYDDLQQYANAIPFFQKARLLHRQIQDADGEATDLSNMGDAYVGIGQYDTAAASYQDALALFRQSSDRSGEATDLNNLMMLWSLRDNPRLAIFYGKQSVNVYQSIRQDIQGMNKNTQKAYLKDKEPIYRQLAELLIGQGRLPEAEQVLGMLKDQEFFDFVRRDPEESPTTGVANLTPLEATWQARYQVISHQVTEIGKTKVDLLAKQLQVTAGQITLTPADKQALTQQLTQADSDLTVANQAYQDFLTQIATESQNAPKATQDRVQTVTDATAFEDTLRQLGPGTVAIYTIVEPDKVRILLVTSQTQVAREYPIKDTDLRVKVLAFRQVLQDPTRDPRPRAHELYTILVGPIEKDLQGAQAQTLMWSLDDVLRYLPMAALYDGHQYLVESYKNEVFTPASESRLTETPQATWNGLGLGVSQAHPGFLALTGVPQELDGVIHDPNVMASQTGALPGTILLDTAFTQQAMTQALEARTYPLVHIASHFDFEPGDETASFLLLGDGSHLSLSTIKTLPQVFQGVDLLTLSACDTADGTTGADGREVEGFAVLAQRLGAKAVIASLWPVADASTPLLMQMFYKQHTSVPGQPKAEALRQAQLSLLHGTVSAPANNTQRAQIIPDKSHKSASDAPPFTPDPKAPFAHPYYWAPFILIGNWK